MKSSVIRVLLVDDGTLFAESLKRVLERTSGNRIEVSAIAHDGIEAIRLAREHNPDVVLMDVRMPGVDGISATEIIHDFDPSIRVVVLTNFDDDDYVSQAIEKGAVGYLLKDITPERLVETIQSASDQAIFVSPAVAAKLCRSGKDAVTMRMPEWFQQLSRREQEILACMVRGETNKEIAKSLNIAEQTVRNHVSEIYFKSDLHDRIKLIETVRNLASG